VARNGRPTIEGGRLEVTNDEPLKRELEDFVNAVRTKCLPGVTGREGRDALELATRVADAIAANLTEPTHP
jgi:predicted dehydrogenase